MILVDTSVWIKFFNKSESIQAKILKNLLEEEMEICSTELIVTEILQGIGNERLFTQVKKYLLEFPIFEAKGIQTYIHAANIYRTCRRKGKTIRKTIDTIIAAIAIENKLELFHDDKDFNSISECVKLEFLDW